MTDRSTRGSNSTDSSRFRRNQAIIIGIDSYSDGIQPLSTAVNDAKELAQILKGYEYSITLLTDEQARLQELQKLFQDDLPHQIGPDDRLLVYFAGHGVAREEKNGPKAYLIPQDAQKEDIETFWPMTELHQHLEQLPCRHLLIILDCCFAGAFRWSSTRDFQPLPETIYKERFDRFLRDPAQQVITSAAYNQKALDTLSGYVVGERDLTKVQEQLHSPFALCLFDALAGKADVIPDGGDGIITATELASYLQSHVSDKAEQSDHAQLPQLWSLNNHGQGEFIFLLRPENTLNLPSAPDLTEENNPYKGLSSYEKGDSKLFFGRTNLIKKLQAQVERQPFTVVLGASGTGKSSLVKAGLLPTLENNTKESADEDDTTQTSPWFILEKEVEKDGEKKKEVMRPGTTPLAILNRLLINDLPGVRPEREEGSTPAGMIGQWRKKHPEQKLLLVIDQFEEIITLCREEEEREDFIHELMDALGKHSKVLRIVLTLRSDFEAQISRTELKKYWQKENRFGVPPMTRDELREVIEKPAKDKVFYFEPHKLIEDLIDEVIMTPGALPLLSFTLSELYRLYVERQKDPERQNGNRALTEADYEAIGGVIGSLRRRIDNEYEQLPDAAHKETMKRIMLRMVAFEGGEVTRRRVPRWELDYPDPAEKERVEKILDRLLQVRLIVGGKSETSKGETESYVEPAHDALIVAWDKLLKWRAEEAEAMLLQRQLTRAAADWENEKNKIEKTGLLWNSNPKLLRAQELLKEKGHGNINNHRLLTAKYEFFLRAKLLYKSLFPSFEIFNQKKWLNHIETDFVRESIKKNRYIAWVVIISFTTFAILLTFSNIIALIQREKAIEQERKARQQLAMNYWNNGFNERDSKSGSTLKALHYLAKAEEEFSSLQQDKQLAPNARLARKFIQHNVILDKAVQYKKGKPPILSQDRRRILFWNSSGFQVADTSTGKKIADIDIRRKFHKMAFSHDGAFALAWSFGSGGSLWMYDTANGKEYEFVNNEIERIRLAKFSQDGTKALVVYQGSKNGVFLIDVNNKSVIPHKIIHNGIKGAVFSKNNNKVLTWGIGGDIRIFDIKNSKMLTIKAHKKGVYGATFGRTPDQVMSWSDSSLILRDITTGKLIFNFKQKGIVGAAFDNNGERILTWSKGGIAYILDNKGNELFSINCNSSIHKSEFNANESRILTWCENGTARVWDSRNGRDLSSELKHGKSITLAGFNHDESRIVTSGEDGTMRIWKNNSNNSLFPLMLREENGSLYDGWVNSAVFSPDGSKVLTASNNDLTARIWSSKTGKQLTVMREHIKGVNGAAFSSDGSQVLTWSQDATARVWDSATGKRSVPPLVHDDDVRVAMFSNDGAKIMTRTFNKKVRVWDNTGQLLFPALKDINGAQFNSKGDRILAWSNKAGMVQVRNADTGDPLASFRHKDVREALFYKNGKMVLTWDNDNPVRLWDIKSERQVTNFEVKDKGGIFANNDSLVFHENKSIFLAYNNRIIKVFKDTGRELAYPIEYKDIVAGASFNQKGDTILSWSETGEIDSFKLTSTAGTRAIHNKNIATIRHNGEVNEAIFNTDESKILSWSNDKTARLWDSTTGRQLIPAMKHGDNVVFAQFNRDENRILTRSNNWDGKARLWEISIDKDWPADKVLLKVEVETGTEMTSVGEVHALSIPAWQKRKWCEYDKIQYQLKRISQEKWQNSQHLCEQVKASTPEEK